MRSVRSTATLVTPVALDRSVSLSGHQEEQGENGGNLQDSVSHTTWPQKPVTRRNPAAIGPNTTAECQAHKKTATYAAVHADSQKRVMGLEPTTFTLAT
jgi:hypothetical protein